MFICTYNAYIVLSVFRWLRLYMTYSPCAFCADKILEFSRKRPQCDITIAFTCIFKHKEKWHQDGLRRLDAEDRITIKVFTSQYFSYITLDQGRPNYSPRALSGPPTSILWPASVE